MALIKRFEPINRLIYFYREIEGKELYSILKENLDDIERFVKKIRDFIKTLIK